jgi:hypothetical protein
VVRAGLKKDAHYSIYLCKFNLKYKNRSLFINYFLNTLWFVLKTLEIYDVSNISSPVPEQANECILWKIINKILNTHEINETWFFKKPNETKRYFFWNHNRKQKRNDTKTFFNPWTKHVCGDSTLQTWVVDKGLFYVTCIFDEKYFLFVFKLHRKEGIVCFLDLLDHLI